MGNYMIEGKEESILRHLMQMFGCLTYNQCVKLLYSKPEETAMKIIDNLKKRQYLFEKEEHYISGTILDEKNPKVIDSFWTVILLLKNRRITYDDILMPFSYPSQIYVNAGDFGYDIVALGEGEGRLVDKAISSAVPQDEYQEKDAVIFVVRDKALYAQLSQRAAVAAAKNNIDVQFVILNYNGPDYNVPSIEIVKPSLPED